MLGNLSILALGVLVRVATRALEGGMEMRKIVRQCWGRLDFWSAYLSLLSRPPRHLLIGLRNWLADKSTNLTIEQFPRVDSLYQIPKLWWFILPPIIPVNS